MSVGQGFGQDGNGRDSNEPLEGVEYVEDDALEEPDLVEEDEPLPWLESDYDEQDEGVDTGRLIGFILLSLVALALLLAAVWWFLRDKPDPDMIPDGSTIEAPDGPIKERPEDEGGKEFPGTGNVAPGVGEGRTAEGRLAEGEAPKPSIDTATSGTAAPAAGTSGVAVQVGAFSSKASAESAWGTLKGQTTALDGFKNRVVEGEVDGGKVFRLQAIATDAAAANKLCNALKGDGIACQVKN